MTYIIGIFSGVIGSTLFGLMGSYILPLSQGYLVVGMIAWFFAFGLGGFFSFRNVFTKA